jgi:hypothetical protein
MTERNSNAKIIHRNCRQADFEIVQIIESDRHAVTFVSSNRGCSRTNLHGVRFVGLAWHHFLAFLTRLRRCGGRRATGLHLRHFESHDQGYSQWTLDKSP